MKAKRLTGGSGRDYSGKTGIDPLTFAAIVEFSIIAGLGIVAGTVFWFLEALA